eukprot:jgi/Mesvir1/910/Mv17472-RA.1
MAESVKPREDPVAYASQLSESTREKWVDIEYAKRLRTKLSECYMVEGVNHHDKCVAIAKAYMEHINKPSFGFAKRPEMVANAQFDESCNNEQIGYLDSGRWSNVRIAIVDPSVFLLASRGIPCTCPPGISNCRCTWPSRKGHTITCNNQLKAKTAVFSQLRLKA